MTKWAASLALVAAAVSLLYPVSASPAEPSYEGTYTFVATCVSVCSGVFTHHLTIASYSAGAGSFSGTGYSVSPPTRWTITGTIKGGRVSFHIAYTAGNPGYTFDGTGTVAPNGSMSGTGTDFDSTRPAGSLTWTATKEAVPAGTKLSIDWEMPPRLSTALENDWGQNPYGLPRRAYVDPDVWKVSLFLTNKGVPDCPSGTTYTWHVTGNGFSANVPGTGCSVVAEVPELGVYDVTATDSTSGVVSENKNVVVRDWVLVGLGDSNGSGEGNPPWQFAQCDRSLASSQYRVAQYIEDHDPHSSVTLLFASCSGATVEHLWKLNYDGIKPDLGPPLLPQIKQVVPRLDLRSVDAVVMSAGINNLRFGPLMAYCIGRLFVLGECESERVAATLDKNGYVLSYVEGAKPDPTLANTTKAKLRTLPSSYSALASRLRAEFDFHRAHIFITEYPDFAHNQYGDVCTGLSFEPFPRFYPGTWVWLNGVNEVLNLLVARTSQYGWKPVGGIADDFERHGYCSTKSYFLTIAQSLWRQYDKDGSLHPTSDGQQVTFNHTRDDVCDALYGNPTCDGTPPWH
jgi:hypothetical protein